MTNKDTLTTELLRSAKSLNDLCQEHERRAMAFEDRIAELEAALTQEREDRRDCEGRRTDCLNRLGHVMRTLAKGRTAGHDWMAAAIDAENSILDFFGYEAQP